MCTNMDNIEQQCDDAVFEVCDARERYPTLCANELARCIQLENEICVAPVKPKTHKKMQTTPITHEQKMLFDSLGIESKDEALSTKNRSIKLKDLWNQMEDLQIAAEQIGREKYCEINIERILRET